MSKPQAFIKFPNREHGGRLYDAVVDRVWDGDTFFAYVEIPDLDEYTFVSVRIPRYRAPEVGEPDWERFRDSLLEFMPLGQPVKLKRVGKSFERFVCETTRADDGANISDLMLERHGDEQGGRMVFVDQWAIKYHDREEGTWRQ